MKILPALAAACLFLSACTAQQLQVASQLVPPIIVGAASASPVISSDVAQACATAVPKVQSAATTVAKGGAAATVTQINNLVSASCTLEGQVALTANDAQPVSATNSGNSPGWLNDLATAASVIEAIAPVAEAVL